MSAVSNNGLAVQFASDDLKHDKEVIKIAVVQNGSVLKYVDDKYREDDEIMDVITS